MSHSRLRQFQPGIPVHQRSSMAAAMRKTAAHNKAVAKKIIGHFLGLKR
jgi:hypothetical protein